MATEIEFHTGLDDKLGFACRLLRKAYLKGARVVVAGDVDALRQLDAALWTFEPLAFVPHVFLQRAAPPDPRRERTPLWLVVPGVARPSAEVLVNLGPEALQDADAYARVIELVAREGDDRDAGRRRWRHYEAQGLAIKHHAAGASA